MEPIVKFDMVAIDSSEELRQLLVFEQGLLSATALDQVPPNNYPGSNPAVEKAYEVIKLARWLANKATIFETDMIPYWLALLEWTLPVVVYPAVHGVAEALCGLQRRFDCGSRRQRRAVT